MAEDETREDPEVEGHDWPWPRATEPAEDEGDEVEGHELMPAANEDDVEAHELMPAAGDEGDDVEGHDWTTGRPS